MKTLPPNATYLAKLRIESLRCFRHPVEISFLDPNGAPAQWTLIIGDNGIGKTTVLRSIQSMVMLFGWLAARLRSERARQPIPQPLADHALRWFGSQRNAALAFHWAGEALPGSPTPDLVLKNLGGPLFVEKFSARLSKRLPAIRHRCYAYGAARHVSTTGLAENPSMDLSLSLFDDDAKLINIEEFYLQVEAGAAIENTPQAREMRDRIKEIFLKVLPGIKNLRTVPGRYPYTKRVEVHTPYGWASIHDIALGHKTMLAWIVDFFAKLLYYHPGADPTQVPSICLIDEIDLHMHPKWQREVMDFLTRTFPYTQFIATAHSPLVVQAAEKANIVLLSHRRDHVRAQPNAQDVQGWRLDQILTSDLFGIDSARSKETAALMAEQDKLLAKPRLTPREQARLAQLNAQLDNLPFHNTPAEYQTTAALNKLIQILQPPSP